MSTETIQRHEVELTLTLARETRTIVARGWANNGEAVTRVGGGDLYGVFPTGNKAHRTSPSFWLLDADGKLDGRPVHHHAIVATSPDGRRWLMDSTLYTHNSNRGRIVGWADTVDPRYIAKW